MTTNLTPKNQKLYIARPTKIVNCSLCGRPIDINIAYRVINGPSKKYYCNKEEYEGGAAYVALRDRYENDIKDVVSLIISSKVQSTTFNVLLNTWLQDASYQKIYYYLHDNIDNLRELIASKQITGSTQRLKYLSAVIINNIIDYKPNDGKRLVGPDSSLSDCTDYNIYAPRMLPRKNLRRSMEELEEIYCGDDKL